MSLDHLPHYQWDLNYENPAVLNRMIEEMLFLANQGVEILRLDAVAFIWKRLGTNSQNLPEAHWTIQAFNAIASIATLLWFSSQRPSVFNRIIETDQEGDLLSPADWTDQVAGELAFQ